jgi:hypothetical protein
MLPADKARMTMPSSGNYYLSTSIGCAYKAAKSGWPQTADQFLWGNQALRHSGRKRESPFVIGDWLQRRISSSRAATMLVKLSQRFETRTCASGNSRLWHPPAKFETRSPDASRSSRCSLVVCATRRCKKRVPSMPGPDDPCHSLYDAKRTFNCAKS